MEKINNMDFSYIFCQEVTYYMCRLGDFHENLKKASHKLSEKCLCKSIDKSEEESEDKSKEESEEESE